MFPVVAGLDDAVVLGAALGAALSDDVGADIDVGCVGEEAAGKGMYHCT